MHQYFRDTFTLSMQNFIVLRGSNSSTIMNFVKGYDTILDTWYFLLSDHMLYNVNFVFIHNLMVFTSHHDGISQRTGKRFRAILPQEKFDLAIHVFVINSLAFLVIYSSSRKRRLFVISCPPPLFEIILSTKDTIECSIGLIDVIFSYKNSPGYEWNMSQDHLKILTIMYDIDNVNYIEHWLIDWAGYWL